MESIDEALATGPLMKGRHKAWCLDVKCKGECRDQDPPDPAPRRSWRGLTVITLAVLALTLGIGPASASPYVSGSWPAIQASRATGPVECQYYVFGARHRVIDVVIPYGQHFRSAWPVTVVVVKGGWAWAQVAHPDPHTAFVRFIAPFNGGAGTRHYVTVGTTACWRV